MDHPELRDARVVRMLGSEALAAGGAFRSFGPDFRWHSPDFFPGVPDSVWAAQLEATLGLDFDAERAQIVGPDLVGVSVVAHGLNRAELNGVCGKVIEYHRKGGRCAVLLEAQAHPMLLKPTNLRRVEEEKTAPIELLNSGIGGLVAAKLKLESLRGTLYPPSRFDAYYLFRPLDGMYCGTLCGASNKLSLQEGTLVKGSEHMRAMFDFGEEQGEDGGEETEVEVIFPLEFNFPGGHRAGPEAAGGVLCFIRSFRWKTTDEHGAEYRRPVKFEISDSSCYKLARAAWDVISSEID